MKRIAMLLLCLCLLTGCALQPPGASRKTQDIPEEQVYEMLFDLENKVELKLDMAPEELEKMQADYDKYDRQGSKSPIYRMADLTITLTTPSGAVHTWDIPEVGVRMKGNTSRTDFYDPDRGIYNIIHLKLDFQETFDDEDYYGAQAKQYDNDEQREARKDRTFATLEKLDLRWNRCDDGTYLKEHFAFQTYRRYGVLAPRTNLAALEWAGIHMGVFTINEPVDKVFLEKNLPEPAQGGDLYKVGWAGSSNGSFLYADSMGVEDEDKGEFFAYDLKTNKKSSTHQALTAFIQAMNAGNVTKESFGELVDVDTYLPFTAVSYLLGNPDDMRNNYNNFYVYFRPDTGKAVFIPYDYDRCLGITAHWNPTGNGVTRDNPFSNRLLAISENDRTSLQKNPVILYSVASGGYYVREYADLLRQIAEGDWFTFETFEALYQTAEANYAGLAAPEKEFDNTRNMNLSFSLHRTSDYASNGNICIREYLASKLTTLYTYLEDIDYYAEGTPGLVPFLYIRADFTDWQMDDRYVLTPSEGQHAIRLSLTKTSALKVYDAELDRWYGSECVADNCAVPMETDGHTDIVLPRGEYLLYFDTQSASICIIKE